MSLLTVNLSFLSLTPKVWIEGDRLCARSSLLAQCLSLFSYSKRVVVDRHRRLVLVGSRFLWAVTRLTAVPFDRVSHINYDFSSMGTSWGYHGFNYGRSDSVESYVVSLELRDPTESITLFKFRGEGAEETGWGGVVFGGDSMVDFSGNQEAASQSYIRLLKEFLGVTIGKPPYHASDASGVRYTCSVCDRPSAPNQNQCLYCGGSLEPTR